MPKPRCGYPIISITHRDSSALYRFSYDFSFAGTARVCFTRPDGSTDSHIRWGAQMRALYLNEHERAALRPKAATKEERERQRKEAKKRSNAQRPKKCEGGRFLGRVRITWPVLSLALRYRISCAT